MKKILIATSGYYYKDWKNVFYPAALPAAEYLSYYSRQFPFTELNFSYYRQPEPEQCHKFLEETKKDFIFTIKGHRSLTHIRDESWKKEAGIFLKGIEPLLDSGRLGAVLLQFPFSFKYTIENRMYLADLCTTLNETCVERAPLSIEFRNREWNRQQVLDGLSKRDIGWINPDNPALPGLPAGETKTTSKTGYLRFHGRNRENWWKGTNVSRYDYNYSVAELQEMSETIKLLASRVKRLFIAFNNHHKGQAVENALELTRLIESQKEDILNAQNGSL